MTFFQSQNFKPLLHSFYKLLDKLQSGKRGNLLELNHRSVRAIVILLSFALLTPRLYTL